MEGLDVEQLQLATKDIVRQASRDNSLHEITPRLIRQRVEAQMELEEGSLDAKEYRDAVKVATAEAIEELESTAEQEREEEQQVSEEEKPVKTKKRKSDATASASAAKKKSRTEKATKPKSQESTKKAKDNYKKAKGQKVVRSASVVPSSDEDDNGDRKPAPVKKTTVRKQSTSGTGSVEIDASMEIDSDSNQKDEGSRPEETTAGADESSNSEPEDEAPKRARGKKKAEDSSKKAATGRKRKIKDTSEESPHDQEIKRLKSFVTACGVRKVWSKEFKDILEDKPAQIRRLKSALADLGMAGRLSMEKAKAVRAKRELAQELEDVKNFEKAVVSGATESRRVKKSQPRTETDQSEAEIEDVPLKKRRPNARMSIMAFLGDQSDDE